MESRPRPEGLNPFVAGRPPPAAPEPLAASRPPPEPPEPLAASRPPPAAPEPLLANRLPPEELDAEALTASLLAWYEAHERPLPWRRSRDPYTIWIAETMLQQTRVATVVPYYERWLARLPTIVHLASASTQEVLQLWQGLGYYRRAYQLHRTARLVVEQHGGRLPDTAAELARLPGIGPYTSAAIAAIAFHEPVAAIDGNLRRTLARLAALAGDPTTGPTAGEIRRLAALLVEREPAKVNQALMDLGAMVCLPRQPRCAACPLASACQGHRLGEADRLPESGPRRKPRAASCFAFLLDCDGHQLVGRRPNDGLLPGLWEFPLVSASPQCDPSDVLSDGLGLSSSQLFAERSFVYIFTHLRLTVHPYRVRLQKRAWPAGGDYVEYRWADAAELDELPVSALMRRLRSHATGQVAAPPGARPTSRRQRAARGSPHPDCAPARPRRRQRPPRSPR